MKKERMQGAEVKTASRAAHCMYTWPRSALLLLITQVTEWSCKTLSKIKKQKFHY